MPFLMSIGATVVLVSNSDFIHPALFAFSTRHIAVLSLDHVPPISKTSCPGDTQAESCLYV